MSTDPSSDPNDAPTPSPHDPPRQDSAPSHLDYSQLGKGRRQRKAEEKQKAEQARLAAESTKRLCFDLPSRTHLRFKRACVSTNRKMTTELLAFIEQRVVELEKEAVTLEQDAQRWDATV